MKPGQAVKALAPAAIFAGWCGSAEAYRPFDGTDAAVADLGDAEIELGPVEYLREGSERALIAPDLRVNYGFAHDWEASIEGDLVHALAGDIPGTSLIGDIASLKTVLREGTLQQKPGPSVAAEFGLLLPGIRDQPGAGFAVTGIISQQWRWATVHFNAAAAVTRDQHADYVLDAIVEGPRDWPVRPVCEFFYEADVGESKTGSGLVGAIWQVKDDVAVDFALRGARINDHTIGEIRAGVTFAFGVGPKPVSGLMRTILAGGR